MGNVKAVDIAKFLNTDRIGEDMDVTNVSSLSIPKPNSLIFAKKTFDLEDDTLSLVLCTSEYYD